MSTLVERILPQMPFRARSSTLSAVAVAMTMAMGSGAVHAQSASGDITAAATVVRSLQIIASSGLNFGTLSPSATQGTVVLDPSGSRSATGGVTLISTSAGTASTVSLQGTPALSYSVALPSSVTLNGNNGGTMALSSLTTSLQGNTGSIASDGSGNFAIGGTLAVAAAQAVDNYSGTFQVTLNWN